MNLTGTEIVLWTLYTKDILLPRLYLFFPAVCSWVSNSKFDSDNISPAIMLSMGLIKLTHWYSSAVKQTSLPGFSWIFSIYLAKGMKTQACFCTTAIWKRNAAGSKCGSAPEVNAVTAAINPAEHLFFCEAALMHKLSSFPEWISSPKEIIYLFIFLWIHHHTNTLYDT